MQSKPPPVITVVPRTGESRPFWSVMIPAYRPGAKYLRQVLESVLQQAPGSDQMQIEVVDDCSADVDVAAMVKFIAGKRVAFSRTPKNLGLAGCWNTCIQRSRGQWVHILHQDDFVLPGFYQRLEEASKLHPEVSLIATRSFFVDGDGVITGLTDRVRELENGGRGVDAFFYVCPLQCAGVAVRRAFYEANGGFKGEFVYTLDWEMWTRAISSAGGLVTSEVLSCWRKSDMNETSRLTRNAEGLYDISRLNHLFAGRHAGFDYKQARQRVCYMAIDQAERYSKMEDSEAVKANLDYWRKNSSALLRLRHFVGDLKRSILG